MRTAGMSSTRWPRTQWSCVLCHLTTRWQESLIPDPNRMPVVSEGSIKNVLMQSRDGKPQMLKVIAVITSVHEQPNVYQGKRIQVILLF